MGALKKEMFEHMKLRGYSEKTIKSYISCVRFFAYYFMKSPLLIQKHEIEAFFLHLRNTHKSDSTIHIYYESMKYFYRMHDLSNVMPKIVFKRNKHKLPAILSQDEVCTLLQKCKSLKYKTIFTIVYSAGLRVSEVAKLKITDINLKRKTIFVRDGKNKRNRYTLLADEAIKILELYRMIYRPVNYLFYGKDIWDHISVDCIQKAFRELVGEIGMDKSIHVHTLRHCFATHLLENGTSIFYIMHLLGHSNIQTTMIYLHMRDLDKLNINSPLDKSDLHIQDFICTSRIHFSLEPL